MAKSKMMTWYHVSVDDQLPALLSELRKPRFAYLDVCEDCFCIAPTVWQCVLPINKVGELYIYEVGVKKPIAANVVNNNTADFNTTHEHRITQGVLDDENGSIPLWKVGQISITRDELTLLKVAFSSKKLICNAAQEKEHLWEIVGEQWKRSKLTLGQLEQVLAKPLI